LTTADDLTVVITTIPTRKIRLNKALRSVHNQTLKPFEIIVQEDTEKRGAPSNRDAGLSRVKTPYVAFLDDDDYFYPSHLETLYKAAQEHDADIVYSWFDVEGGEDPFPENFGKPWNPDEPVQTTVTTLCKTEVVRAAGGFSSTYGLNEEELATYAQGNTVGEDFRMVMSALKNGAKVHHVPKKTWAYVHWGGNTSGRPDRWDTLDAFGSAPAKLLVIVPSRSRPDNAQRLLEAIDRTSQAPVDVVFAVDADDPLKDQYPAYCTQVVEGGSMVAALNQVAVANAEKYPYIGFLGDDTLPHRFWYGRIMWALESKKNSMVYGNDLIHGEGLPTAIFMDSNVIRSLGFMAPPGQKHLYVDNYWKALGDKTGNLIYVNDAVIEHLHPLVSKAENDEVYDTVNSLYDHDHTAFNERMSSEFFNDVRKLS
jgi:glycosyltransferase involved in cell wall biosynthesis